ncbi:hypothetical protein [Dyella telluris]|uniref:Uncharacterized protein n=1 Tax=Dyella telluris TaxID=2763498 RepID=A0A7G8Q2V3_9GAMM|nr:hypothetical protein [Dyella telluris]QNK01111.1 hypothetical protein H8F01_18940 [Dyella telluris]
MNMLSSKGHRARTARGVTLLSLLASTMSFASVVYIGPETARESLGLEHATVLAMPDPRASGSEASLAHPALPGSRMVSAANLLGMGGAAVGLRASALVEAPRMAVLGTVMGEEAVDTAGALHRAIEPRLHRCPQAALVRDLVETGKVLQPAARFLALGADADVTIEALLRDSGVERLVASAAHACTVEDPAEGRTVEGPGTTLPRLVQLQPRRD